MVKFIVVTTVDHPESPSHAPRTGASSALETDRSVKHRSKLVLVCAEPKPKEKCFGSARGDIFNTTKRK